MELVNRVISSLEERRDRLLNNKLNCIPSPFKRFREDFIGIEQSCQILITSSTKGAKSQFTSYTFIYKPLMFCYYTKANINYKVIYFPLEETPERIMQRFMSWLLYDFSHGEIRISPRDLRSTTTPLPDNVLELLKSDEIQDILKYFEEHVIFPTEKPNPTGIYYFCKKYAEDHGTVHTKPGKYTDQLGNVVDYDAFDYYEQDDPNEYRIIIIDTINLIDTERGMNLKQSIDKLSEYCAKYLRNRYHYSPVIIQQQAFDGEGNEAVKLGRYTPSISSLGDSKYGARDSNIVLGLFSPFKFALKEYNGYDITKFRDNIRFLEVCINRDGQMGGVCPLFFDGAVCQFSELPRPDDSVNINKVYEHLKKIRNTPNKSFFIHGVKKSNKKLHRWKIFHKFAVIFKKWRYV